LTKLFEVALSSHLSAGQVYFGGSFLVIFARAGLSPSSDSSATLFLVMLGELAFIGARNRTLGAFVFLKSKK
jgi:hypothetical protein